MRMTPEDSWVTCWVIEGEHPGNAQNPLVGTKGATGKLLTS